MKRSSVEIIITFVILALLVFFVNPFMVWMPNALHYMIAGGLVVSVALFAGLFWRGDPQDEREELHRHVAARFAYITGVAVLAGGIIIESFVREPDIWLVVALGAMVVAKLAGHFYSERSL